MTLNHHINDNNTIEVSVSAIQADWRVLDHLVFKAKGEVRLLSHEKFESCAEIPVEYIAPGKVARGFGFFSVLFNLIYAEQLLARCDSDSVLIVNGGTSLWLFVGLLNRLFFRRRRCILCWDVFIEVREQWKRAVMSAAMRGITLSVLWSRAQIEPHAEFLGIPKENFIFLPYKANHSKGPRYDLPIGRFVFSGGNGKRDYKCLTDAVSGTTIPVVVSTTDLEVRKTIKRLSNVIVIGAPEPAFAQLQAASQIVVIPMIHTGLKGGGEANFCNAMWHGKPVVAADSIAASDYILEGETGFVVPSGDSSQLRKRLLELWNDPNKARIMGTAARCHAEKSFTHSQFVRRLLTLASIIGMERKGK